MSCASTGPRRSKLMQTEGETMLTQERLRELLHYDPATGIFRWRVRPAKRVRAGDIAGHLNPNGYITIRVDGRLYYAQQLAFLYVTGEWPAGDVDHRDGVRANNRWENLRPATRSENLRNMRLRSDNRSGLKGAHYRPSRGKWQSSIRVGNRTIRLGSFDSAEAAHAAYCEAAKKYFGEFARAA